jgi:hypothetical protein
VNIVAINCAANGRVAQDLFSAKSKPTRAAVVIIRDVPLIIMA